MSQNSKIEWTEATWNPVVGCTKISQGCKHCYAEAMSKRLQAMGTSGYENGFRVTLLPARLEEPLNRKKPTIYFVNSMSDLFHKSVPDSYIDRVLNTIKKSPQHTFQLLTKRVSRLVKYFNTRMVPENAWIGVSIEDKESADKRIAQLSGVNSQVKFLSIEPLLECLGDINFEGIHWVIVGGESGPKARPMSEKWVQSIKRQCIEQNTLFFFKQWGAWGADGKRRAKKVNGRLLSGRTWDQMPML